MSEANAQRLVDNLVAGVEASGTNAEWTRAASLLASRVRQSEDYAAKCERQRHEIARLNTANATLTRRVEELEGALRKFAAYENATKIKRHPAISGMGGELDDEDYEPLAPSEQTLLRGIGRIARTALAGKEGEK